MPEKTAKFNPDDFPEIFFANWFEKEHFEWFLGKELTDKEFQELKKMMADDPIIADAVSEIIREHLESYYRLLKEKQ